MKCSRLSHQRHDLYAKYHGQDRKIRNLLGECGLSQNVDERFKVERLGSFIRTASQIPRTGQSSYLPKFLANGLLVRPFDVKSENMAADLNRFLPQTDHVYRMRFLELQAAMEE